MSEFFRKLFYSDFMAHGHCYFWRPEIVWLHAISDCVIAASYYFIPVMLVYLVRKRRDLPFHWMFLMFGIFILGCGTTHVMELWTLWHGTYRLAGLIKAITAAASVATAIALVPMIPKAVTLPSPEQLRAANRELEKEIAARRLVEEALEAERNFVAAVLNTVDTLIVVADVDGKIIRCNGACLQAAGRAGQESTGKHIQTLFSQPEEGEHFEGMVLASQSERPERFESSWTGQDGNERVISWSTTTLPDAGGNIGHVIAAGIDITEAKRLEKTVLEISAREQRRIAQDLHDGLGQHLTGIAFKTKAVHHKLAERAAAEAVEIDTIVHLVNDAISRTRELARGLLPVEPEPLGLMSAIEQWAFNVEHRFGVPCRFSCEIPIPIFNEDVATNLYRIAQEAVTNAIKHGQPSRIDISLESTEEEGIMLRIKDNGIGIAGLGKKKGLGLQIMQYRARMMDGTLQVGRAVSGGTLVTCTLPPSSGQTGWNRDLRGGSAVVTT